MKNNIFKIASVLCVMTLFAVLPVFSGGKPEADKKEMQVDREQEPEDVVLTAMMYHSSEKWKNAFGGFEERIKDKYPEVSIKMDVFSGNDADGYNTKLRTLFASGALPDVFYSHGGGWIAPLADNGALLPIEDYLDELNFFDMTVPIARKPSADGHIYAVPAETIFYEIILYNKRLFADHEVTPPRNFEELTEVVNVFNRNDIVPITVAGKSGWPIAMLVEGFAYTVDTECTKKVIVGKTKFSDNEAYQIAAQKVKELMDMGAFVRNIALTDNTTARQMFLEGKAAMYSTGSWDFDYAVKALGKENVGWMYYPAADKSKNTGYGKTMAGGVKLNAGICVSAETENPIEAVKAAIEISLNANEYFYRNGDVAVIYQPNMFGWKTEVDVAPSLIGLMDEVKSFVPSENLLQDAMPTAAGTKAVMDSSAGFMTGNVSVEQYLRNMDKGLED